MKIAVTDTNIFIDLISTELLPFLFQTEYVIHTIAEVVNELNDEQQAILKTYIKRGMLVISSFSSDEISELERLIIPSGLSYVDLGIFYYSKTLDDVLILSNDNLVRKTCKKHLVEIHGTLWLMDFFFENNLCTKKLLHQSLSKLTAGFHRFPAIECRERLLKWEN